MAVALHAVRCLTSVGCAVVLAGCGEDAPRSREPDAPAGGGAVSAHYVYLASELGRLQIDVITDDPDRIRMQWSIPGDAPPSVFRWVYDGDRLLAYGNDSRVPYDLYESAVDFDDFDGVRSMVLPPGSAILNEACPGAHELGTKQVAGATAVGYRCDGGEELETPMNAREVWLESTSGLVLEAGRLQADEVDLDATVDADTFSTDPPDDARVKVVPAG